MKTVAVVQAEIDKVNRFISLLTNFDTRVSNSMTRAIYNGSEVDILNKDDFGNDYTNLLSVNVNKTFILKLRQHNYKPIVGGIQAIWNKTQVKGSKPHFDTGSMLIYNPILGEPLKDRDHKNHIALYVPNRKMKYPSIGVWEGFPGNLIHFYSNELKVGEPVTQFGHTTPAQWAKLPLDDLPIDPTCPIGLRFEPNLVNGIGWSERTVPYSEGKYMLDLATDYCQHNDWFHYRYDRDRNEYTGGDRIIISAWQVYEYLKVKKERLIAERTAIANRPAASVAKGITQEDVVKMFRFEQTLSQFKEYPGIVDKLNVVVGYEKRGDGTIKYEVGHNAIPDYYNIIDMASKAGKDLKPLLAKFTKYGPDNSIRQQYRLKRSVYRLLSQKERSLVYGFCIGLDIGIHDYCFYDTLVAIIIIVVVAYLTGGLGANATAASMTSVLFSILLVLNVGGSNEQRLMKAYIIIYAIYSLYNGGSQAAQSNKNGVYGPFVQEAYQLTALARVEMAVAIGQAALTYNQWLMEDKLDDQKNKTNEEVSRLEASTKALREKRRKQIRFLYGNDNYDYFDVTKNITSRFDSKYQYYNNKKYYKEY